MLMQLMQSHAVATAIQRVDVQASHNACWLHVIVSLPCGHGRLELMANKLMPMQAWQSP